MADNRHTVRFKGVTLGSLTANEISERLRAGQLSLAHVVEHQGRWLTIRQFLRETAPAPATPQVHASLLDRLTGRSDAGTERVPPPPGSDQQADAVERRVQQGYLWCGLTFVIPLAAGLPIWLVGWATDSRSAAYTVLLILAAVSGSGCAAWKVTRTSAILREEGLEDVARSMRALSVALAVASTLFWSAVTLIWLNR